MPTRTLLRLSLLAALAAPLCAFALGVGPLAVRSALNQNFDADIPLIVNNPGELTGLTVRIPRQQDFDRVGIDRLALFSTLRFSVQTPPGGPNLIKISSVEPIREPNFNLLLELAWSRGRLIREFTVQIDPELYANRRLPPPPPTPTVIPPPAAAAPAPAPRSASTLPPAPAVNFEGASAYGPIRPGETLMAVANRVRPSAAISLPQMMSILLAGNSGAFVNGNPDALRAGAMLKVPTAQALGVQGAPTPPSPIPDLAAVPPPAQPSATLPPAEPVTTAPPEPPEPPPAVLPPPVAAESSAPPAVTPPSAPVPAPAPSMLSPAEQPREIIPQATIPQAETPPPEPAATTAPNAVAPPAPPAATPQQPEPPPAPAVKPPPAKPPVQPVVEAEPSWMSNPVVWIAIALILLAIISVILLPLLRRPARPKPETMPATTTAEPPQKPVTGAATGEPADTPSARTQVREPSLTRPLIHAAVETGAAATAPHQEEPVASKPVVPQPRSVTELLRDIDFGGEGQPLGFGDKNVSPTPTLNLDGRLPDAEPPTASAATRKSVSPLLAEPPTEPEPRQAPPKPELPSELRLDGFDFDFGELGLQQTASQPVELPPLEMKPAAPSPKFSGLPSGIDTPEPATEPASISSISSILSAQKAAGSSSAPAATPEQKFEFADVTQELERHGNLRDDSLKLDDELHKFGSQTLDLGKMKAGSLGGGGGGDTVTDYVETKLDLATAFLDMGDQVGARGLLEEVLREGNTSQKQRAEELLKKVVG
ncbi:MAG TPA: FimV/HubP family polar landmark protein [Candidatus Competibacter sp.]|nr:FimV/HubP family polar landmark protein [Candidatus Competibacter sp.]